MSENRQSERVETTHRIRNFIIYVVLLVLAFLLGLVPMWWLNSQCASSLSDAERQSSLVKMENSLASAAIDARRGDYETARQAASDFFTSLRTEFNRGVDSALSPAEIAGLQPLLTRRDEIITLLARGDATSADLLSDLYVSYRTIVNR
jgi:hypothetical protein